MTDAAPLSREHLAAYLTLKEVGDLLEHAVEKQLRDDAGLTVPQFQILARLSDAPDRQLRMTDLADGLVYSRSGLTYQAGQLEKAGLVTRTPGEEDERSVTVTLTATGGEALARVMPGHVDVVRRLFLDVLEPADVEAVSDILGRVRDRMREAPPRSAAPRPPRKRARP